MLTGRDEPSFKVGDVNPSGHCSFFIHICVTRLRLSRSIEV